MDSQSHSIFTSALLDPEHVLPAGLKTWNGSDPGRRFDVYRNNVVSSLISALAASYPVVETLVGHDFFSAMARIYVSETPPTSRLLAEYGDSFPQFLETFPPVAELPYLADVGLLEQSRVASYHSADAVSLAASDFQTLLDDPTALLSLRLELHPACRWFRCSHAAFSIWAAHQGDMTLAEVDIDVPEEVLVIRPAWDVKVLRLPEGGVEWLNQLAANATLSEAVEHVFSTNPQFDLTQHLTGLIEHGLAVRLIKPNGTYL